MQNTDLFPSDSAEQAGVRPQVTAAVTRGVSRLFQDLGCSCLTEFRLPNGRRADVAALTPKGQLIISEVKSCQADFTGDQKWNEYIPFCDAFYFAVDEAFPKSLLPDEPGLIVADGFHGAIVREAPEYGLAPARRKSLTLKYARQAAVRLAHLQAIAQL
ncbi:MAG: DNA repair putative endonuclease MmcB [Pseudomonadota bacterium]